MVRGGLRVQSGDALAHMGFVGRADLCTGPIGTHVAALHPDHAGEMAHMIEQVGGDNHLLRGLRNVVRQLGLAG